MLCLQIFIFKYVVQAHSEAKIVLFIDPLPLSQGHVVPAWYYLYLEAWAKTITGGDKKGVGGLIHGQEIWK